MSTIAFADCPSGIAGDMFLAACLDLGLPLETLESELAKLDLDGYVIKTQTTLKQGITARLLNVECAEDHHHRTYKDITELILSSSLSDRVKSQALAVFELLGKAEAKIHSQELSQVAFHEVGAVDSIVDIVGACIGLEYHGIEKLYASPLPLGTGFTKSAHGRLPLPAPATLAVLEGVPTYGTDIKSELVTPTGAAVLKALAESFGPIPAMTISGIGYGAGTRNLPDRPNLMRLIKGQTATSLSREKLIVAEANLDDMNPEIWPYIMERLMNEGALDTWLTTIQMKKGRPGVKLSLLARPAQMDKLIQIVMAESTTLGIRTFEVDRLALKREPRTIKSPWGEVNVKAVSRNGKIELIPEYEVCLKIAKETGLPLKEVYSQIIALISD